MTDFYRMTWQEKDNDQALIHTGPVLWHRKDNPYWAKEAAPYTYKEALATCKRWNRICPTTIHNIIPVTTIIQREEIHNGDLSAAN